MTCTHDYFDYEDPIHYSELHVCPLSCAFPACQYTEHPRDEHEEGCKQYRIDDIQEEVGDFAKGVANEERADRNALVGRDTCGRRDQPHCMYVLARDVGCARFRRSLPGNIQTMIKTIPTVQESTTRKRRR